jgi:gingipain R
MTTEETGITPEQIKNTIKRRYQEDKISTVILVGDAEYLAPYPGSAGNAKNKEADPLYGVLEGNDSYPEVMVGRFSVKSTDQLQTIVNKIISYEKNPETDDWYSRTAGIASNEGSPTDWQRAEELRSLLESWHYTSFKKHYDPGVKAADISSSLNNGLGFINYIGHGSKTSWVTSDFSTKDIINLKNGRKMPFIVSVACVNGQFAGSGESFAERWLLAGTPKEPQGAIAIFASSTNQSWVPPHRGPKRNRAPSDFGPHGHNRHSLYPWLYRRP